MVGPDGPVDFRAVIGDLSLGGARIVADDPLASRCRGGFLVTADGPEAEVATPPHPLQAGFTSALLAEAYRGHHHLRSVVDSHLALEGWSTHLSVEVGDRVSRATARLLAERFAPALMLMMDRACSPGLLVRPRPSRLEIGGEFVTGDALRAAATMTAGGVLACARVVEEAGSRRHLPQAPRTTIEPARSRFGHYIDRTAFGGDLYDAGRSTRLRSRCLRRSVLAQTHLQRCWEVARAELEGLAAPEELALTDAMVAGDLPLPLERSLPAAEPEAGPPVAAGLDPLDIISRPMFVIRPELASWDFTAYSVVGQRRLLVCIPQDTVESFHAMARVGELDDLLTVALSSPSSGLILASVDQTQSIGIFDELADPARLTPDELDPVTGLPYGAGGGRGARRAKREQGEGPAHLPRQRRRAKLLASGLALALLLIAATAVAVAKGGDDGEKATSATSVPTTPTTVRPDSGPFAPTAAQRRSAAVSGSFEVVHTVTESDNITAPVGTTQRQSWATGGNCSEAPCTYAVSGAEPGLVRSSDDLELAFVGSGYVMEKSLVTGCFDPTGAIVDPTGSIASFRWDLAPSQVAWRNGNLVVTELRGTMFLTGRANPATTSAACVDPDIRPVTYSVLATLEP